jgi:transposase InsO family protein
MIYGIIKEKREALSISACCKLFNISRTAYYHNLKSNPPDGEETSLRDEIEKIILKFPGYGYRRVTKELRRRGYSINHKKVLRIMHQGSLLCQLKRAFKPAGGSEYSYLTYPNLSKDLVLTGINQLWASDITYIRLPREFCYLAVILDSYSRKIIGWHLSREIDQELTLKALKMALKERRLDRGLIHHSDQGAQYACKEYTDLLKENSIKISMSAKGNPYENARVESFFKTLKHEEVYLNDYRNIFEAIANIGRFMEDVYNKKRLHSAIDYLSPEDFERKLITSGVS